LRRELCAAAVATAKDPRATGWTRLQAICKAEELMTPPPSPEELRDRELVAGLLRDLNPFTRHARGGREVGKPEGA
jgi:hypothetical protein